MFTREEVRSVISRLESPYGLMVRLIYAGGLRLEECLSLRMKDLDFDNECLTVFPRVLHGETRKHKELQRRVWEQDRRDDRPAVSVPSGLARKYPHLGREWGWFWLFPAVGFCADPHSCGQVRWHLRPSVLQRQVLEDGYDIRTIQDLLGAHRFTTRDRHRGPRVIRAG